MYRSIDRYDAGPGSQGNFYSGHKITIVIWPVGFSKDLSTLDILKAIKLHMSIKHVHKSFGSINEKTSTLFVELISILVNRSMHFNNYFDLIFFM